MMCVRDIRDVDSLGREFERIERFVKTLKEDEVLRIEWRKKKAFEEMSKSEYKKDDAFHLSGDTIDLGIKKPIYNTLRFSGDKIEFTDRTVTIKGFTVKEFVEQFDKLVFIDKDGRKVTFKKEKNS